MSSIPVMLDMPFLIESELPKEVPEEIEPEKREENMAYDNCVPNPETDKLIKIIKTFQSVTPPMIDVNSVIESEHPKEETDKIEPEERIVNLLDGICVLGPGTGKVIQELKKNPDPEPITRPELHTNKKETQFSPQEKSSRFLFQCELCNLSFEHEQNFHVHKWVHEFKKVSSSVFLNDFDGLSTKPMIEMPPQIEPPQIEFKLPNEEPEEIEPEKRIVTFSDGNCVIDPETGKLTKIIKTFQSVTPPMIDVPSLFESKLPKEEPEEMEQEEREENLTFHNRFLDPETGNLIKIEEPEKSPEPECQPEPKPSVRPVMMEDEIKLVADDPMVELVSKELNHFGVIADLFRQIRGHSSRFVLFCSF